MGQRGNTGGSDICGLVFWPAAQQNYHLYPGAGAYMSGFFVLYRWRIHPDMEAVFAAAWAELSSILRQQHGSLGSRLHRGNDGLWYSYAQWSGQEAREMAFSRIADAPALLQMRTAIAEALPEILLEPVADFLLPLRIALHPV